MNFCDKLDFLIKITQVSNKELASAMSVDRSLISLLRNGKRGMPKNNAHIKHLAEYFAKHCTADYQKQALSEITGLASFCSEMPIDIMALQIEYWLTDKMNIIDNMASGLHHKNEIINNKKTADLFDVPSERTAFYYGSEGRKQALRHIISIIKDSPILMSDNSDMNWIISDYQFSNEILKEIKSYMNKGNIFCHILPPMTRLDSYAESMRFLLPVYAGGQADVYYYPRIQSTPHEYSIIIAPKQCVMISYGVQSREENTITIVSTDEKFIDTHTEQFKEYIALCRSALKIHKDPSEFYPIAAKVTLMKGTTINKVSPLSSFTMPKELIEICIQQTDNPVWKDGFNIGLKNISAFEKGLKENIHIDISRLAAAKDIRSGKCPIGCPYLPYEGHPCYTPETYIMHLQNILRLMDKYENYTFVPVSADKWQGYNLIVNESGTALLVKEYSPPEVMLEFNCPEMITACQEYLFKIAEKEGYTSIHRKRIRIQINSLISELEK